MVLIVFLFSDFQLESIDRMIFSHLSTAKQSKLYFYHCNLFFLSFSSFSPPYLVFALFPLLTVKEEEKRELKCKCQNVHFTDSKQLKS